MNSSRVFAMVAKFAPLPLAVVAVLLWSRTARNAGTTSPGLPFVGAHLSPSSGVFRDPTVARGDCQQCHISHAEVDAQAPDLFARNDNMLCYSTSGIEGCHINRPTGGTSGYPAQEADRLPDQNPYHGYFEANSGGQRLTGTNNRVRWPGRTIFEDLNYSKHYSSPNMPRLDPTGHGSCLNCHEAHDGATPYDQLVKPYGPISGSATNAAPPEYNECFQCHSSSGPGSLPPESKRISDYYSRSVTGSSRAGHGIQTTRGAVKQGDRLPCYDCHNPHGSMGNNGQAPNGFLISDQRPGWYGLTDIRNDSTQVRRFCTGCHAYADQTTPSIPVEGITAPKLPDEFPHRSYEHTHCYDCHGRDYSTSNGNNVHNPGGGD